MIDPGAWMTANDGLTMAPVPSGTFQSTPQTSSDYLVPSREQTTSTNQDYTAPTTLKFANISNKSGRVGLVGPDEWLPNPRV